MDMSLWTKLNPIVKRVKVKKLFFNRYLYKIKFYCPGARAIYSNNFEELRNLIYSRLSNETHWYALYENYQLSQNVRLNQLQFFQILIKTNFYKSLHLMMVIILHFSFIFYFLKVHDLMVK